MPNQPDPQPQDQSIVFGRFDGYTNVLDRERLGPRDLSTAYDVDLDDGGQPHRRRGRKRVVAANTHSLWNANDGTVYCAQMGSLGVLRPDYSFINLGVSVGAYTPGSPPVAYCQVGDDIYFSTTGASGVIKHSLGVVRPWGPAQDIWLSPVINPTATLPAIRGKLLGAPPRARFLTVFDGRIYLAADNVLWATEYLLFDYVDKTRTFFQFEGTITMIGAVSDGLYVGTNEGLYFLGGRRLAEFQRIRVMDSPVIPGSAVTIPGELANPPQVGIGADTPLQVSIAFMTTRGFCVAEDSGKATNLTEGKVFFPVGFQASAFFRRQDGMNHYIVCTDSGGDPLNGARFGDFVDPQIARGNSVWVDVAEGATAAEKYT